VTAPEPVEPPRPAEDLLADANGIYRILFHGAAYRVLERVWREGDRTIGQMAGNLPPNHKPGDQPALASPRLIELCFQTAAIVELQSSRRMALPHSVDSISVFRAAEVAEAPVFAVVTPTLTGDSFDADVVDASGNICVRLKGYRTIALPGLMDIAPLQALHAIAH
jgi:hypothetical protein